MLKFIQTTYYKWDTVMGRWCNRRVVGKIING